MKLVALTLALSSCSFVMTDRPKPPPQDPDCSRSYTPVVLDILGALTWPGVVGVAYAASASDDLDVDEDEVATLGVLIAGTFIAEVISAGVGISRVGDCKDAYRERAAYPYYPPPGYGPVPPQPYAPPYPAPYPQPQPQPQPQQPPPPAPEPPRGLGIEGDTCAQTSDCAAGLTCRANRCAR